VLQHDPDSCINLSIHHDDPEYEEKLRPILELLDDWVRRYGIQVKLNKSYKKWTRRYKGFGARMEPFEDKQPRRSWENCRARDCPQLFEGKIWKCAPLAYLKLQDAKYHLSDQWTPYLHYRPLGPDCSDEQLNEFFDREEEFYCGMCPAQPEPFRLPVPLVSLRTVSPASR
jgi:hypothetical protein